MRPLRDVALLHPFQLPIIVCLLLVSLVFTVFPEALSHTAVSFEDRGIIHHLWHYALLLSSALILAGLFSNRRWHIKIEFTGLVLLFAAMAVNLVAAIDAELGDTHDPTSGLGMALRVGTMAGLLVRMWIVIAQPVVHLPTTEGGRDA